MKNKYVNILGKILPTLIFVLLIPLSIVYISFSVVIRFIRRAFHK